MSSSSSSSTFSGKAEKRELGANGVDVIDEFCEASIFDEAAKYLSNTKLKLTNEQKLTFYALFKQATIGPCNTPKPSILSMYDRTKWNAWNDLGKMNKDEAIMRYVNELEKVAPSWQEQAGVITAVESDSEDGSSSSGGGSGGDGAMIMPQSRPVVEEEIAEADMLQKDKHIWHYAGQGNINMVREWVKKGTSVNEKDEEGRTPLHWAVDRGLNDLARVLIVDLEADVNSQDSDGATPLHYAALCEHLPLIELLLKHGADPSKQDADGATPAEAIREVKGVTPEILALLAGSKTKDE